MMIVLPIAQIVWYRTQNARRDRMVAGLSDLDSPDFTDKTDFEQAATFRYVM